MLYKVRKVSFMGYEQRRIIRKTILGMDRPFNVSDLFYKLETEHGIENRSLILEVLDELCDSGAINYLEVQDDCWAFSLA